MQKANLSLIHEILPPKNKLEKAPLLLLLHGYGSHEQDLFSFAPMLHDNYFIVSARAPISLGFGGFAWFDINIENGLKVRDYNQAKDSLDQVKAFIQEVHEAYGTDPAQTDLLGFSQGCMMSYALALNEPEKFQNIMALSGYVLKEIVPENYKVDAIKHLNFFVSHGTMDDVLPVDGARQTVKMLEQMKLAHQYREYPIGHGVSPENFTDLKLWLKERGRL